MKITDNRKKENIKSFRDMAIGDVFHQRDSSSIYMKTEEACETMDDGFFHDCYVVANAICLNTGHFKRFLLMDKVIPLNCECIITNK